MNTIPSECINLIINYIQHKIDTDNPNNCYIGKLPLHNTMLHITETSYTIIFRNENNFKFDINFYIHITVKDIPRIKCLINNKTIEIDRTMYNSLVDLYNQIDRIHIANTNLKKEREIEELVNNIKTLKI